MIIDGESIYSGCKIYIVTNYNQGYRKAACIYKNGIHIKSVGYAKYLMEIHLGQYIPDGYEVDHINGDCTDDRIENLQVISRELNSLKEIYDHGALNLNVMLKCPYCGRMFFISNRDYAVRIRRNKYISCTRACSVKMAKKAESSDRLGSPFRPEYEYMIGYFYDLNYILEIEKRLETNNVKFIKKYR